MMEPLIRPSGHCFSCRRCILKHVAFCCVIVGILTFAGCSFVNPTGGSGHVISETRNVSGFDSVSLDGEGELVVDQNGAEGLTITADDNLLPLITSEVKGNRLILSVKPGTHIDPSREIVFKLSAKNLKDASIAGSGAVDLKNIQTDALRVELAGSADITAAGSADHLDLTISGSGKYLGSNLKAKDAKVNIAGSGDVTLTASETLDATVAGSGDIKYYGDPRVTQHVFGSG